jgi:hypothetical protein
VLRVPAKQPSAAVPANPLAHSVLGPLLRYWQQKCAARTMPSRRDIDPLEMRPDLLPHLVLTDLLDRGTRVRFRLVGTTLVKRWGVDPTGRYLGGELKGGWWEAFAAFHRLAYAERSPLYGESEFVWDGGRRLEARLLLLPLTQDGPDPAIALGAIVFTSNEAFPPTLRALADTAAHSERTRQVLKSLPAPDTGRASSREVA